MKKTHVISILLFLSILFNSVFAIGASLLGPNIYVRTTGPTNIYVTPFSATTGSARLFVENGEWDGDKRIDDTVSSAYIYLNDELIFGSNSFNKNVAFLESTVNLLEENILRVELNSAPESFLRIRFTRPSATIEAVPPKILINTESTLNWISYDSVSCTINQDIGSVDTSGSIQVSPLNTITYTITATDSQGLTASTSSTVTVNNYPDALGQSIQTDEDTQLPIVLTAIDKDNDPLTFSIASQPVSGELSGIPPNLNYIPNANFNGSDSFTFVVNDGMVDSDLATVSITINPVNDFPVSTNDSFITNEDTVLITGNVLANDTDVDGDVLSVHDYTQPSNGSLTYNNNGTFTYAPSLNYYGSDSFTYIASDGNGGTDSAEISITINPVNDAPTVVPEAVIVEEDGQVDITFDGYDVEGDSFTYIIVSYPAGGTLTGVDGDNQVTYVPNPDYNGPDTFTFKVSDGDLESPVVSATITITPVNDQPVAEQQSVSTDEDNNLEINLTGTDIDEDALSYQVVTEPTNGTLDGVSPNIIYIPNENFHGTDSFSFKVNDGLLDSDTATISITVNPVNDQPVAEDGIVATDENMPITVTLTGSDIDSTLLNYTIINNPAHGILTGNSPNLTYTPDDNYFGEDLFTYIANDGLADSEIATVSITIIQTTPPVPTITFNAEPQTMSLGESSTLSWNATDADDCTIEPGNLQVNCDDSIQVFPLASTTYIFIANGQGGTASSEVTISVAASSSPETKIEASDLFPDDGFGWNVSISGDYAIVGKIYDNQMGSRAGAAYIYKRGTEGWTEHAKLVASDARPYAQFGNSVAIDDNYAVVGIPYDNSYAGSVYVFKREGDNWIEKSKLSVAVPSPIVDPRNPRPPGPAPSYFGNSVAIDGDYLIAGEPYTNNQTGAAYIYKREAEEWIQQAKLTTSDGDPWDRFGYSVSISGDFAIIGAYNDDKANNNNSGSAYIFKRIDSVWTEYAKITSSDGQAYDYFGYSVSIDGDNAVVGAHYDDDNESSSGSAYIFSHNGSTWLETTKIVHSDGEASDLFGYSVSISGGYVSVGSYNDDDLGSNSGSTYIFKQDSADWIEYRKLNASDGVADDKYGWDVSIDNSTVIIGAPAGYPNDSPGSVYIYDIFPPAEVSLNVSPQYSPDGTATLTWSSSNATVAVINNGVGPVPLNGSIEVNFTDTTTFAIAVSGPGGAATTDAIVNYGEPPLPKLEITTSPEIIQAGESSLISWTSTNADSISIDHGVGAVPLNGTISLSPTETTTYTLTAVGQYGTTVSEVTIEVTCISQDYNSLYPSDYVSSSNDKFGFSVATDGVYAIVGAPGADDNDDIRKGAIYIFKNGCAGWVEVQKLVASDGVAGDNFGYSVALEGDYAIVGTPYDDENGIDSGAAYILKREGETWIEQKKILGADISSNDLFGNSVAIDGEEIIIGAVHYNSPGAAYIFKRDGSDWTQQTKLTSENTTVNSSFGKSVSIHNGYAVVGHPKDDTVGWYAGSTYIYKLTQDGWIEQAKLFASDSHEGDYIGNFGHSVSIRNDQLVVGAINDSDASGSVYTFKQEKGSWIEQEKLIASDWSSEDNFGFSVSIYDDYVVIGAINYDYGPYFGGFNTGSIYIFSSDEANWEETLKHDLSYSFWANYGYSVDISNNTIIAGAPNKDNAGFAFIINIPTVSLSTIPEYTQDGHSSLVWSVENVYNCSIEPEIGTVESIGSSEIFITEPTDYTLTCSNPLWGDISSSVTVRLGFPPPEIIFDISDDLITQGKTVTLSWAASNSTTCALEPGFGVVDCNGDINISPLETTTYTLTATGLGGTFSEHLNITVLPPLTIEVLEPNGDNDLGDNNFYIKWQHTGVNENSTVSLYYDLDNKGEDGTLIISDIAIDDLNNNTGTYNWDTSSISEDEYYIYAIINDGLRPPVTTYSAGPVKVVHPACALGNIIIHNTFNSSSDSNTVLRPVDLFGSSFAITGDYAFVGVDRNELHAGYGSPYYKPGVVFVYKHENGEWNLHQRLIPSDTSVNNFFGHNVSVSGDYAIISAGGDDDIGTASGAAYIFKLENGLWVEKTKIVGLDTSAYDRFGQSVFIDGDYAVVGAWGDDDNGGNSGSAYVFKRNGEVWSQQAKLLPSNGISGDSFGSIVQISGDHIMIGGNNKCYFFNREGDSWVENSIINNVIMHQAAMSISGNFAILNINDLEDVSGYSRSIYIFKFTGSEWLEEARLTVSDSLDELGGSVSIKGNIAIVGTGNRYDFNEPGTFGSVYLFVNTGDTWSEYQKIVPCNTGPTGKLIAFGRDVYLTDGSAYIWGYTQREGLKHSTSYLEMLYETAIPSVAARIKAEPRITPTGDTILTWSTTNADSCVIEPDIGPVETSGSIPLQLDQTTNFTIIASGQNSIASAEVEVVVGPQKITPEDLTEMIKFGKSVAISGDYAVIGAPYNFIIDNNGNDIWRTGSVYVYKREGYFWVKQTQLYADEDLTLGYYFGSSLDISGDFIIVGSTPVSQNESPGTTYIFKRDGTTWIKEARLIANNAVTDNYYLGRFFGSSVAIEGDYAIVGNPKDANYLYSNGSGAAYIFKREGSTWIEQKKITPSDALSGDGFGRSIDIQGNYAILGATDAAYILKLEDGQWIEQEKLTPPINETKESFHFGHDVSISGETAVVLSYASNPLVFNSPIFLQAHVYEFVDGQWVEQEILEQQITDQEYTGSAGTLSSSVSINSDFIFLGNPGVGYYYDSSSLGYVYIYKREGGNWIDYSTLAAPDTTPFGDFGLSLSLSPSHLIVGSNGGNEGGLNSGAAYIFPLPTTYAEINADPAITPSGNTTLTWLTVNADIVTIEPDIGVVESFGAIPISVTEATTYTITASGYYGTATDEIIVTAGNPPPNLEIDATGNGLLPGQSTTISWSSENAEAVTIDNGIGSVSTSGTITVSPLTTTTYTITASGVGGQYISNITIYVYQPPTADLNITPNAPTPGDQIEISWSSSNGNYATLTTQDFSGSNEKYIVINGSESQNIYSTTIFTLTVTGHGGTATDTVIANVEGSMPLIDFSNEPYGIFQGEQATLTWQTLNAESVFIDNDIGEVPLNGSMVVSPEQTTTYTLTATGQAGTSTTSVTINVIPLPTVSIDSIPQTINPGESVTLQWTSENALMCSINQNDINQNIGYVPCSGALSISPTETTTYTITASGTGNTTATDSVTVTVIYPQPTVQITASPQDINAGETATLIWSTSNAESCTLEPDIGTVDCTGSLSVAPATTTIYTLTATGSGGTVTAQVPVNVLSSVTIEITKPSNNETLYVPQTSVTGTVTPIDGYVIEEVGITVNGYPAQVNGDIFFVNNLPLEDGENTITVTATLKDGTIATKLITVFYDSTNAADWIEMLVNPYEGIAPLDSRLSVNYHLSFTPLTPTITADGPGVVDITQTDETEYELHFEFPGLYQITFEVSDDLGATYQQNIRVNVLDRTEIDNLLQAKWNGMKAAMAVGDIEAAVSYFAEDKQDIFREIYTQIQPNLPEVAANMQDIELLGLRNDSADYFIRKDMIYRGEQRTFTFYVYFKKDWDNMWKIWDF